MSINKILKIRPPQIAYIGRSRLGAYTGFADPLCRHIAYLLFSSTIDQHYRFENASDCRPGRKASPIECIAKLSVSKLRDILQGSPCR